MQRGMPRGLGPHELRLAARLLLWTGALLNGALHLCEIP